MTVRVGFIGAGGIAGRHLSVLQGFEDVVVTAVADPAEAALAAFAERSGATAYRDWRAMLDAGTLDALWICVPPFAHGAPELAACDLGLPFFVEKPLAADADTAERIGARVAESGLATAVGYHWRYLDTVEHVRGVLAERPAKLVTGYWIDSTPPVGWWGVQARSGGQFVEQTTHIFDLARHLVGEVASVYAAGGRTPREAHPDLDIHDVSTATLTFASGAVGTITSTCLVGWPHRIGLNLFGDDLVVELTEREMGVYGAPGTTERGAEGDPFEREDRDFIDAVKGETDRVRSPYAEALRTHRLTMAAVRSAETGAVVRLEAR